MSECITRVERITKVEAHPNADKLEVAHVKGWHCVVRKGVYKDGDLCVYIPIDSVLPEVLSNTLFEGTNIKPASRIKTIRLRGLYSQGLICSIDDIRLYLGNHGKHPKYLEGTDLTALLGITKYEPPAPSFQSFSGSKTERNPNPNFKKYKGFENFKNHVDLFNSEDEIVATEKIHGTNFRAGWIPREMPTKWYAILLFKLMSLIKKDYKWQWLVGSHNVQLSPAGSSLYANIARDYNLKEKLNKGEEIFGEIFGPTVQKGYHYGLTEGQFGFVAFDLIENGEWKEFNYQILRFREMGIDSPPILFKGKFKDINIDEIVLGDSVMVPAQKIREGVVLRTVQEESTMLVKGNRKMLKCISPEYLLKENTDFH
ncbi:MAG: RNA ligase (ATP) [Lachnospiraceae bacterium]|nr:RNA ligase (ATP) [Lachnospiraceae bacterium]